MMVPRGLTIQRRQSKGEARVSEKNAGLGAALEIRRPRSAPVVVTHKVQKEDQTIKRDKDNNASRPPRPARMVTEPVSVPSQPVFIPPRSPSLSIPSAPRRRSKQGSRRSSPAVDDRHNPRSVPPSVAALLAVTSIPPPNPNASQRRRTTGTRSFQKTSIDELLQEWREEDYGSSSNSVGAGSPLDILLDRAEDSDGEDVAGTSPSLMDSSLPDSGDCMSSRSVSSDSIPSVPDLVHELRSPEVWNNPKTPSGKSRRPGMGSESRSWKDKVSKSPPQECHHDHPLLPPLPVEEPLMLSLPEFKRSTPTSRPKSTTPPPSASSSFKSNLTASLNALASSFRSWSNFTAPSIPPDDLLTRNMFSPTLSQKYAPEMRPKSSDGIPDPALRQYLDPTPGPERARQQHQRRFSLEEQYVSALSLHHEPDFAAAVNASSSLNAAIDLEGPMIQMQTYGAGGKPITRSKRNKKLPAPPPSSKDLNTEAGRIARAASRSAVRQREPRENSDFLRVIVLEMNMRREGKLDAKGLGRARVWLPPRKGSAASSQQSKDEGSADTADANKVPVRWVGVGVEEA